MTPKQTVVIGGGVPVSTFGLSEAKIKGISEVMEMEKQNNEAIKKAEKELLKPIPAPRSSVITGVTLPIHYKEARPQRNDLCKCGSGKKYKKCCYFKDNDGKGGRYYVRPKQDNQ